ncbi:MAG: molybdopterin-dependent oxidoreductase [Caldilineaceae bacterium]|nr:molybdopterin-dependent oxidoreductase [Caldilineaceae bacterium]
MVGRIANPRRQEEEELRAMRRLPPGQALTHKFPILHYGQLPEIDLAAWTFRVSGAVEEERVWTWSEFNQLPRTRITLDLHCVTRWSKFDTIWEGVAMKTLVEQGYIRLKPEARFAVQHCEHGYTTNTPVGLLLSDNMLMATHYDNKPLDLEHGYPLRMVIGINRANPNAQSAYLWKGGKWLRGVEFTASDRPGFWERLGYNNEADPWREQRYA